MIANNYGDVRLKITCAALPKQLEQAVILTGGKNGDAWSNGSLADVPVHAIPVADRREVVPQSCSVISKVGQFELDPQEKTAAERVGAVLIGMHDVGAALEQEGRDRGDDSRAVRTGYEEASSIAHAMLSPRVA
jgi:hypothetical protein